MAQIDPTGSGNTIQTSASPSSDSSADKQINSAKKKYIPSDGTPHKNNKSTADYTVQSADTRAQKNPAVAAIKKLAGLNSREVKPLVDQLTSIVVVENDNPGETLTQIAEILQATPPFNGVTLVKQELAQCASEALSELSRRNHRPDISTDLFNQLWSLDHYQLKTMLTSWLQAKDESKQVSFVASLAEENVQNDLPFMKRGVEISVLLCGLDPSSWEKADPDKAAHFINLVTAVSGSGREEQSIENAVELLCLIHQQGLLNAGVLDAVYTQSLQTALLLGCVTESDRKMISPEVAEELHVMGLQSNGEEDAADITYVSTGKIASLLLNQSRGVRGFEELVRCYISLGPQSQRYNLQFENTAERKVMLFDALSEPKNEKYLTPEAAAELSRAETVQDTVEWLQKHQIPGFPPSMLLGQASIDLSSASFKKELDKITPDFLTSFAKAGYQQQLRMLKEKGWAPVQQADITQQESMTKGDFLGKSLLRMVNKAAGKYL